MLLLLLALRKCLPQPPIATEWPDPHHAFVHSQTATGGLSAFLAQLPWQPIGIVDVNLPFEVQASGVVLNPVLSYYNEYFFNNSVSANIKADLKLDLSQFNLSKVIDKIVC